MSTNLPLSRITTCTRGLRDREQREAWRSGVEGYCILQWMDKNLVYDPWEGLQESGNENPRCDMFEVKQGFPKFAQRLTSGLQSGLKLRFCCAHHSLSLHFTPTRKTELLITPANLCWQRHKIKLQLKHRNR